MRKWQNAIIKAKFGGETYCCVPWPMIANDTKGSQLKFRKLMFASLRLLSQPVTTWPVSCGLRNREGARALYPELSVSSETSAPTAKQIMSSVEQLLATHRDHELVQGKNHWAMAPNHRSVKWPRDLSTIAIVAGVGLAFLEVLVQSPMECYCICSKPDQKPCTTKRHS